MNRLKIIRERNGMTQEELGLKLNLKKAAISKYENGTVPLTDETIKKICDIFNVSADYLINNTNAKNITDEKSSLKNILIKTGYMKDPEDLSDEEFKRIISFITKNKEIFK